MRRVHEECPPLSDQVHCTPSSTWRCFLLVNPLLGSDRKGRPLHSLFVGDADMEQENVGIQNCTWLIWQVFYKYSKGVTLVHPEREGVEKKSGLLSVTPSVSVSFCRFVYLTPHTPSKVTERRQWWDGLSLAWQPCSWRPVGRWCHSCGEREHCHCAAAMWGRSHRPTWCRCTPCRVTLGWDGGKDGCWELWHNCSLWAIHSASETKSMRIRLVPNR